MFSKIHLGINPSEFWALTFAEFWPLYNAALGKTRKPMRLKDVKELEKVCANGNVRRTSS